MDIFTIASGATQIKSSLSKTSLHRTASFLTQQLHKKNPGEQREETEINSNEGKLQKIPDWHSNMPIPPLSNDINISQNQEPPFIVSINKNIIT